MSCTVISSDHLELNGLPVVIAADGTLRIAPSHDFDGFSRFRVPSHFTPLVYLRALWHYGSVYPVVTGSSLPPEMMLQILTAAFRVPERAWLALCQK